MVISYSQSAPHHVQSKSGGQYICDANCPQWLSSQVCSHTLTTAEHNGDLAAFLQWFTQFARTPNISALAMSGLPRGRGRKGGKPKQQCNRKQLPPPDNYSCRLGLLSACCAQDSVINSGMINVTVSFGTP